MFTFSFGGKTLHRQDWVLLISSSLTVMAGAIIAPVLPQISREFQHLPNAELLSKLVLTLPALAIAMMAPLAGYFTDRSGRKRVLVFSLFLYALAGTSGAYFSNIYMLLAGRFFLGMAVGGLMTAVVTLIGDFYDGEKRSQFMGIQAAFSGIGGLLFISGGGILADFYWRAPFLIYAVSLIIMIMAIYWINEPVRSGINNVFPGFTKQTQRLAIKSILLVYLVAFFSMAVFYMIPVQMPFMLGSIEGISNTKVGLAIACMNIGSVATSLNYGKFKRHLSFSGVMGVVYTLVAAGYFIIGWASGYYGMIAGIVVCGAGFGLQMANINLWLVTISPPHIRGRLVGYLNALIFLGMFLSPLMLQPLVGSGSLQGAFVIVAVVLSVLSMAFFLSSGIKRQ